MFQEAKIIIEGVELSTDQSMALRVAVASMLISLQDEEHRCELGKIADAYEARLAEVQDLIFTSIK